MATHRGSVAMFLVKWLVIPVGLAALGFFVVGPLIGRSVTPEPKATGAPVEPVAEEPSSTKVTGDPDVEVSARPATRRRSGRRSNPRTEPPRNVPDIPSRDEEPPRTGPDGG